MAPLNQFPISQKVPKVVWGVEGHSSKPLCINLTYITTFVIIMGILEEGGQVITCLQNRFYYDSSHKMASKKPIMKFIQKT
jgi:hypothetical protein